MYGLSCLSEGEVNQLLAAADVAVLPVTGRDAVLAPSQRRPLMVRNDLDATRHTTCYCVWPTGQSRGMK